MQILLALFSVQPCPFIWHQAGLSLLRKRTNHCYVVSALSAATAIRSPKPSLDYAISPRQSAWSFDLGVLPLIVHGSAYDQSCLSLPNPKAKGWKNCWKLPSKMNVLGILYGTLEIVTYLNRFRYANSISLQYCFKACSFSIIHYFSLQNHMQIRDSDQRMMKTFAYFFLCVMFYKNPSRICLITVSIANATSYTSSKRVYFRYLQLFPEQSLHLGWPDQRSKWEGQLGGTSWWAYTTPVPRAHT